MAYVFIFYLIFLLGFLIYSLAGIYHLWRFGYSGDLTKAIIIIYSFISAAIIVVSLFLISVRII